MLVTKKHSKFIKIAASLFMMTFAIFLLANLALPVSAASFNPWNATGQNDNGATFANNAGLPGAGLTLYSTITKVIKWFIGFLGIIAVILIIYGGFLWMTSGGDPQKIEEAKTVLKNAVIGLIIIILAFAIVSLIFNFFGGTGGANNKPGVEPGTVGLGALGNGIIESHYPARNQKDVPRNTSIIVTFREAMQLDTLCNPVATDPVACNGGAIATTTIIDNYNVRIFKLSDEDVCTVEELKTGDCPSLTTARVYSTPNKKTFVFIPDSYLGSPSEYINYAVYLTPNIKKADGKNAFAGSFNQGYEWPFEVSNKIDLIPPQVKSGGVFPAPDVSRDDYTVGAAASSTGKIKVNAQPAINEPAVVKSTTKIGTSLDASAAMNEDCDQAGTIRIAIIDDNGLVVTSSNITTETPLGQGTFGQKDGYKNITFRKCNLVLTLIGNDPTDDIFSAGDGWDIEVKPSVTADTLTVGSTVYTFISGFASSQQTNQIKIGAGRGTLINITADNITEALNLNNDSEVSATFSGSTVNLAAKVAGTAGNNINLETSTSTALVITSMKLGSDRPETVTAIGRRDKPMNATIQIEFNEAIMPLQVSGTSSEVYNFIRVVNADPAAKPTIAGDRACTADADCLSFKCQNAGSACKQGQTGCACVGDNNYLEGKFEISNQYRTVNFISDNECGFNSCGEKIYCLPANSHLRVELKAASSTPCNPLASVNPCASKAPFNICDQDKKVCVNDKGRNYPQADATMLMDPFAGGIMDVAINSLDGNRNTFSEGPASYYNENNLFGLCGNKQCSDADKLTICGVVTCSAGSLATAQQKGDNYQWLFFINDQLDLTSPKIKSTVPITLATDVSQSQVASTSFDKLMMSSRLTTGSISITNNKGAKIIHQLINLKAAAAEPLAYWVTNEGVDVAPLDGEPEESMVYINHSSFSQASSYTAQIGSGLKDVYQNCYLPSASLDCAATLIEPGAKPSCCNGTPRAGTSCQ